MKPEEDKADEYLLCKTSKDTEYDYIFNVIAGHTVSAVASEMTSSSRKQRRKNKVR